MRSLRARLIFSHILPVLIVVPLIGLAAAFLPRVHERYLHPEQAKS